MGWPTPQEYNEAIQNPRTAFADQELRTGQPVLTPLGLPRPITGAFASVYQLRCPDQRTYAVRCFLREYGDSQERYAAISAHLAQVRLPYMVNFTYLDNGIRVGGKWYPILKMEWVEGDTLHSYIERNLQSPTVLLGLAEQWVQMTRALRQASIGHGDLQHGNVMVVNGQLRLIDYDGMYVPALAGRSSHEIGHRNYQHPQRNEDDFGPGIDHFSTWVVYTSLVALSIEPKLWATFQGGDECLLFRREDFDNPANSQLFRALDTTSDARLRQLSGVFATLAAIPTGSVPPVDGQVEAPRSNGRPAWLADYAPDAMIAATADATQPPAANPHGATPASSAPEPAWIRDFIGPQQMGTVDFGSDLTRQRAFLLFSVLFSLAAWLAVDVIGVSLVASAIVTAAAAAGSLVVVSAGYWRDPSVLAQRTARKELRVLNRRIRSHEIRLGQLERSQSQVERTLEKARDRMKQREQHETAREKEALARHDRKLQQELAALQARRDRLHKMEADQIRQLELRSGAHVADLDMQIATSRSEESAELERTLRERQDQFVANYLKRQTIAAAIIPGIGPAIKDRLREQGVVRAIDIDQVRLGQIQGIGEGRAAALFEWRRKAEALARQTAPQSISKIEETLIRGRFYQRRFKLEQEKGKEQRKLQKEVSETRTRAAALLQAADQELPAIQQRFDQKRDEIKMIYRERRAQIRAQSGVSDKGVAEQRTKLQQASAETQRDLTGLTAQRTSMEFRLRQYERLEFGRYVRRVILPTSA